MREWKSREKKQFARVTRLGVKPRPPDSWHLDCVLFSSPHTYTHIYTRTVTHTRIVTLSHTHTHTMKVKGEQGRTGSWHLLLPVECVSELSPPRAWLSSSSSPSSASPVLIICSLLSSPLPAPQEKMHDPDLPIPCNSGRTTSPNSLVFTFTLPWLFQRERENGGDFYFVSA